MNNTMFGVGEDRRHVEVEAADTGRRGIEVFIIYGADYFVNRL